MKNFKDKFKEIQHFVMQEINELDIDSIRLIIYSTTASLEFSVTFLNRWILVGMPGNVVKYVGICIYYHSELIPLDFRHCVNGYE